MSNIVDVWSVVWSALFGACGLLWTWKLQVPFKAQMGSENTLVHHLFIIELGS